MRKGIAEPLGVLILIAIGIAASTVMFFMFRGIMERTSPKISSLTVTVASIEPISRSTRILVNNQFEAYYAYRVVIVVYNSGSRKITNLQYSIAEAGTYRVCVAKDCDIYDPLAYAQRINMVFPASIDPNHSVEIPLIVYSKTDVFSSGNVAFVFVVTGNVEGGGVITGAVEV